MCVVVLVFFLQVGVVLVSEKNREGHGLVTIFIFEHFIYTYYNKDSDA